MIYDSVRLTTVDCCLWTSIAVLWFQSIQINKYINKKILGYVLKTIFLILEFCKAERKKREIKKEKSNKSKEN